MIIPRSAANTIVDKNSESGFSRNFVGRQNVFEAIADFLQQYDRGYFTLVGFPGSGKTAILLRYLSEYPNTIYYSAKPNQSTEAVLEGLCTRLLNYFHTLTSKEQKDVQINLNQDFNGLFEILQGISDLIAPEQSLIIALDALEHINFEHHPSGANLLCLPRYLPPKIYFLLSRRPFHLAQSRLLVETPTQSFDLDRDSTQTQQDLHLYCQSSMTRSHRDQTCFCNTLIRQSESNFQYLSHLILDILQGDDLHLPEPTSIPPTLVPIYQQYLQQIMGNGASSLDQRILEVLADSNDPISLENMAITVNESEYDVETILQSWSAFLRSRTIEETTDYSLFHSGFRRFLSDTIR